MQESGTSIEWYITTETGEAPTWTSVTPNTWVKLTDAAQIRWKVVLKTTDRTHTPRINPDIVIRTNTKPTPPTPDIPPMSGADKCYYNTSPVLRWVFNDPDGDLQAGYQVTVSGGSMAEDTGIVESSATEYTIDGDTTGKLFNSGVDTFNVTIRVWDEAGMVMGANIADSAIISTQFCVIAFENPSVSLTVPATGSLSSGDIPKEATVADLLTTKAGGLVTFNVRSIGVSTAVFNFPYLSQQSTVLNTTSTGSTNKIWTTEFYTDANTEKCPDGTVVYGNISGNGIPDLMYLNESASGEVPDNWWQWDGYRKWADGVVTVGESVFDNWMVVLQGRE